MSLHEALSEDHSPVSSRQKVKIPVSQLWKLDRSITVTHLFGMPDFELVSSMGEMPYVR